MNRLYLHTIIPPVHIPKELAAYTLTLNFHITLNDLEEIFLSRFMVKEKPHIDAEQYTLLQVFYMRISLNLQIFFCLNRKKLIH
jgi:hypothetical protein